MKRLVPLNLPEFGVSVGATSPAPDTAALIWSTTANAVLVWTGASWQLADQPAGGVTPTSQGQILALVNRIPML